MKLTWCEKSINIQVLFWCYSKTSWYIILYVETFIHTSIQVVFFLVKFYFDNSNFLSMTTYLNKLYWWRFSKFFSLPHTKSSYHYFNQVVFLFRKMTRSIYGWDLCAWSKNSESIASDKLIYCRLDCRCKMLALNLPHELKKDLMEFCGLVKRVRVKEFDVWWVKYIFELSTDKAKDLLNIVCWWIYS